MFYVPGLLCVITHPPTCSYSFRNTFNRIRSLFLNQSNYTYETYFFSVNSSVLMCSASFVVCSALFCLRVSLYLCGRFECYSVHQTCISSALRMYHLRVKRVYRKCLQPTCCFWSAVPARCLCSAVSAKPVAALMLSPCWNFNTNLLLQLSMDSNINLLHILKPFSF